MRARQIIRFIENGIATLMDLRPHAPTERQMDLAKQLAAEFRAVAAAGDIGEGSAFWRETCQRLVTLATTEDPLFFMRWEPVRATMVHGATPSIVADWWILRRSAEWRATWAPALRHEQYGHPPPFLLMMATNAMAIEHASHLFRFRETTGARFEQADRIVEFGGGYGSMCRLIHAMGFRGTYIIFDLPHVLALQRYYLALHGIDAAPIEGATVRLCADLEDVARLLDAGGAAHVSAISTWALSEMPPPVRDTIEPILRRKQIARILLSYQARFEGNDNRAYFSAFADRTQPDFVWTHEPVGTKPPPGSADGSYYLFGVRS